MDWLMSHCSALLLLLLRLLQVESMANITEVHDALNFSRSPGAGGEEDEAYYGSFGIWSVAWSPGGREMIAGGCVWLG
jgi:hypothetical protein